MKSAEKSGDFEELILKNGRPSINPRQSRTLASRKFTDNQKRSDDPALCEIPDLGVPGIAASVYQHLLKL
jgi:hypothetical protein